MKKLLILITFLLLASSVSALNFSSDRGYDWLLSKGSSEGSYENSVFSTSLAVLAYDSAGASTQAKYSLSWIKDQQDPKYCFPKGACTVKDTALAVLALNALSESTDYQENWLINAQSASSSRGNWWLQVITEGEGICTISYQKNNQTVYENITVNKGVFNCGPSPTFFDLNNCLQAKSIITTTPTFNFFVDCQDITSSTIITLIYNSDTSYYIMDQSDSATANMFINNGCFGKTANTACDYESSLYALWALSTIQSKATPLPYLEEGYDEKNILHTSMLLLSTGSQLYYDNLKLRQNKENGGWDNSVFNTALAVKALNTQALDAEMVNLAKTWLEDKQAEDGSWNQNIKDTAMALYSSFQDNTLPSCTDGKKNGFEEGEDCGGPCEPCEEICNHDGYCDDSFGEDCDNCPDDCTSCDADCGNGYCDSGEDAFSCPEDCGCGNGFCDINGDEDSQNCPDDCECGDWICDYAEENYDGYECPDDCDNEPVCECSFDSDCSDGKKCDGCDCITSTTPDPEGSLTWIWIILIILLLVIVGYYFYAKKKGKDPLAFIKKKPKSPPPRMPFRPTMIPGARPPVTGRPRPPALRPFRR